MGKNCMKKCQKYIAQNDINFFYTIYMQLRDKKPNPNIVKRVVL